MRYKLPGLTEKESLLLVELHGIGFYYDFKASLEAGVSYDFLIKCDRERIHQMASFAKTHKRLNDVKIISVKVKNKGRWITTAEAAKPLFRKKIERMKVSWFLPEDYTEQVQIWSEEGNAAINGAIMTCYVIVYNNLKRV